MFSQVCYHLLCKGWEHNSATTLASRPAAIRNLCLIITIVIMTLGSSLVVVEFGFHASPWISRLREKSRFFQAKSEIVSCKNREKSENIFQSYTLPVLVSLLV